jgi:hypothetical protein
MPNRHDPPDLQAVPEWAQLGLNPQPALTAGSRSAPQTPATTGVRAPLESAALPQENAAGALRGGQGVDNHAAEQPVTSGLLVSRAAAFPLAAPTTQPTSKRCSSRPSRAAERGIR